jgi:hypothetical protein
LLGKTIPAIELTKIYVVDLKSTQVLECKERYSTVKWELFITCDEAGLVIGRKSQAWNLSKSRI